MGYISNAKSIANFINADIKNVLDFSTSPSDEYGMVERIKRWFDGTQVAGEVYKNNKNNSNIYTSISDMISTSLDFSEGGKETSIVPLDYESSETLEGAATIVVRSLTKGILFALPIIITNYSFNVQEKVKPATRAFTGGNHLYLGENPNDFLQFSYVIPEDSTLSENNSNEKAMSFSYLYDLYERYNVSNSDVVVELYSINKIFRGYIVGLSNNASESTSYLSFGNMTLLISEVLGFNKVKPSSHLKEVGLYILSETDRYLKEFPILLDVVAISRSDVFQQLTGIYGTNNGYFTFGERYPIVVSTSGIFPVKLMDLRNINIFKNIEQAEEVYTKEVVKELYELGRISKNVFDTYVYLKLEDTVYKGKFIDKSMSIAEATETVYSFRTDLVLMDELTVQEFEEVIHNVTL